MSQLLQEVMHLSLSRVQDFKPQEVSHLLWGLAELGIDVETSFLDNFAIRLEQLAGQYKF